MSAATKEELLSLKKEVSDSHDKVRLDIHTEITKPLYELTGTIRELIVKFDHQEKANTRLSSDIKALQDRHLVLDKRFTVVETKQSVAVGIGGKFMMPIIYAMFFASNAIGIFIYLNK
tara:strand:- start:55 stop:408 length:354 start_codon:yes stop_codon:yes gene_type:complete